MQKRGITLSQIQRDAISEFSGLEFRFGSCSLDLDFDSVEDMITYMSEMEFKPEVYEFYSKKLIGKNVLQIGSNDQQFLYISDDGKIFIDSVNVGARNFLEYIYWFYKDLPENVKWLY